MNYLIKNAKVVDANSLQNAKRIDILVEQGIITQMGANLKVDKNVKVIEQENLHASPGWFDMTLVLSTKKICKVVCVLLHKAALQEFALCRQQIRRYIVSLKLIMWLTLARIIWLMFFLRDV